MQNGLWCVVESDLLLEIAAHSCDSFNVFQLLLHLAFEILDDGVVDLMRLLSVVSDVHNFVLFALFLWPCLWFWWFIWWFFVNDCWIGLLILVVCVCVCVVVHASSANSSSVMEPLSDDDDLLSWLLSVLLSDSVSGCDSSPTPAIKGLLLSEWVVNLPECQMMKDGLSGMLSCLVEASTCLMVAVDKGNS